MLEIFEPFKSEKHALAHTSVYICVYACFSSISVCWRVFMNIILCELYMMDFYICPEEKFFIRRSATHTRAHAHTEKKYNNKNIQN